MARLPRASRKMFLTILTVAAVAGIFLSEARLAPAQVGGGYDLSFSVVAGGGGFSSGGTYEVRGTAGQGAAGVSSGGTFTLESGFWNGDRTLTPVEISGFEID